MTDKLKNFHRVRTGIDPAPFLDELAAVPNIWDVATGRQEKIAVQREASAIPLRGLRRSQRFGRARRDVHESRWTTASQQFPRLRALLRDVAASRDSLPGRAKVVRLPAGRRVYPHIDRGQYYRLHQRYHLVLVSSLGSWLKAGDEVIRMREGELWWFDNQQVHEARNDGDEDRIHLIFDLLPKDRLSEAEAQREAARRANAGSTDMLAASPVMAHAG